MLTRIVIEFIPHGEQRMGQCGDWQFLDDRMLRLAVSQTKDQRSHWVVALHELVEALLCHARGISEYEVDAFDRAYAHLDDPGNDATAPYHFEHVFAEMLERLLAHELKLDWQEHEQNLAALDNNLAPGV